MAPRAHVSIDPGATSCTTRQTTSVERFLCLRNVAVLLWALQYCSLWSTVEALAMNISPSVVSLSNMLYQSQVHQSTHDYKPSLSYLDSLARPAIGHAASPSRPVVSLPFGCLQGSPCPQYPQVTQYLGVPFAEPPLNEQRFRPARPYSGRFPQPALDATRHPPPCGSICLRGIDQIVDRTSEDCLYLNVWVPPGLTASSRAPVRVYIHGGGMTECSASDPHSDGCAATAKTGSLQVNVQYRKGPLGWLAHPATWEESNTTGNWALMDQQLALRWVRDHIGAFGGDPTRVLLFANSAGAQALEFHTVAPASRGLFSAAISQSPPCIKAIPLPKAYEATKKLLHAVGCLSYGDQGRELACLRAVPWASLWTAAQRMRSPLVDMCEKSHTWRWQSAFTYAMDGVVLPRQPMDALSRGEYYDVPYMVGYTSQEGSSFLNVTYGERFWRANSSALFRQLIEEIYPGADKSPILATYPISNATGNLVGERDRLVQFYTDVHFVCPIRELLGRRGRPARAPTWLYEWRLTPSCPPDLQEFGPMHASELHFVFGITDNINRCNLRREEVAVSDQMMHAWNSMAAAGVPTWQNGSAWEQWDSRTQRNTQIGTRASTSVADLSHRHRCATLRAAKEGSLASRGSKSQVLTRR